MYDSATPFHSIRRAEKGDASEIARLLTALGHPTSEEEVGGRWEAWVEEGNTALVAANPDGTLAGMATLTQMTVLHRPAPVGRITALVVDPIQRGKGMGRALVSAAEENLARAGCRLLEITSHARLVDAHEFYEHLGYERTSIRLAKALVPVAK